MKLFIGLMLFSLTARATIFTFQWTENSPLDLVTNYVLLCVNPASSASRTVQVGPSSTTAAIDLDPGTWECVCMAQNSVGISEPSNMVVVGSEITPPASAVGPVEGVTTKAIWKEGTFDILARWRVATNALAYTSHLINLATTVDLIYTGTNTLASWARVPPSQYRLTITASSNNVSGATTVVELGTTQPLKPNDFR